MTIAVAFSHPPILKGFIVLLLAGCFFPSTGVFVLKLQLIPLRFTLMHGTLLGGAIALAAGLDPLLLGILINLLIVLGIAPLARMSGLNTGYVAAFFMVLTIGLAYAVIYRADVPAKETLSILWGSVFALSTVDVVLVAAFCAVIAAFVAYFFQSLKAVLYDREIAFSTGFPSHCTWRSLNPCAPPPR